MGWSPCSCRARGLKLFTRESLRATWRDEQLARSFLGIWFLKPRATRRRVAACWAWSLLK